jgi:hypothetical protein
MSRPLNLLVLLLSSAIATVIPASASATYPPVSPPLYWSEQDQDFAGAPETGQVTTASGQRILSCDACQFGRPAVSPGASMLATSQRPVDSTTLTPAGPGRLVLVSLLTGSERTLPALTADDADPSFLPSGQTLVFTGRPAANAPTELYAVGLDGAGLRRLTTGGGSRPAPCAGGAVAFQRGTAVWLLPRLGSRPRRVVRDAIQPDCAPSGQRIVFLRPGGAHPSLHVVGLDGRHGRQLRRGTSPSEDPTHVTNLSSPVFSPDGRGIAYLRGYDAPQADGSAQELDLADLSGRVRSRRVIAGQSGGSIGSDGSQSAVGDLGW